MRAFKGVEYTAPESGEDVAGNSAGIGVARLGVGRRSVPSALFDVIKWCRRHGWPSNSEPFETASCRIMGVTSLRTSGPFPPDRRSLEPTKTTEADARIVAPSVTWAETLGSLGTPPRVRARRPGTGTLNLGSAALAWRASQRWGRQGGGERPRLDRARDEGMDKGKLRAPTPARQRDSVLGAHAKEQVASDVAHGACAQMPRTSCGDVASHGANTMPLPELSARTQAGARQRAPEWSCLPPCAPEPRKDLEPGGGRGR